MNDDWTKFQEGYYSQHVSRERNPTREDIVIKLLEKHAPDARLVADVGCGDGGLVVTLADRGYDAIGMDLLDVMYACRKRYPEHADRFMLFDAEKDELARMDVIIALELVEHLKHDYAFLEKCAQSAEHIIICVPDSSKIVHNDHHLRFYPRESMQKLLNVAGFDVMDYKLEAQSQFFYGNRK